MVNPTQIIEQTHALSNPPLTTKQIAPTLLELEASLRAHEDYLAHQFMGRVEAIERTREIDRVGFIPLGHALRMMEHYDVQDLPTANETYDRWTNKGTFLEGKLYANFDLDTITVTVYVAEAMPPHQSTWEGLTYAQIGVYPYLNEDGVILAEDDAHADFETSSSPRAPEYPLIQNLDHLDTSTPRQALRHALGGTRRTASPSARSGWHSAHRTTRIHLEKCGGCHLLFPQAQILQKLCEECRVLTPDILHGCALRPQTSLELSLYTCEDCSEPIEFGVMCPECEEALLSAFEPRSKTKQGLYA